MLKVYLAGAMTGLSGHNLLLRSGLACYFRNKYFPEMALLDPVTAEGVRPTDEPLANTDDRLAVFWKRDKEMIRSAHVVIDLTGPAKSEGVAHEVAYARFNLWKPVVRVWPNLGPSVARYEDDVIVETMFEAFYEADKRWGTWTKRFVWRIKMLNRCLPRWIWHQLGEWF